MPYRRLYLVLLPLWLALPAQAADQKTLTIAADAWCPINCAAEGAEPGVGIELARRVFEPLGYRVHYAVMPWARALEEVRAGKIDAAVGANRTDDPTLLFPNTPIYFITDDFYVPADSPLTMKEIETSRTLRLGVIRDYGYGDTINKIIAIKRKTPGGVQEVGGDDALDQNIRKLQARRIDALIESAPIMTYKLRQLKLESDIKHIGSFNQDNIYLAFSPALKESKERLRQYDEGIARLKAAGELHAIYARYGLSP